MKPWDAKPGRPQSFMERLARKEMAARASGRPSDFQRRIEDERQPLAISRFIANVPQTKLRPHWQSNPHDTDQVVRRTVEIAFGEAIVRAQDRLGEVLVPDWDDGIAAARAAAVSLDKLYKWMERSFDVMSDEARRHAVLRMIDTASVAGGLNIAERQARAEILLNAWSDVRDMIGHMPAEYEKHRQSLIAGNMGEPEKAGFVRRLAEGWDFLFAVKPTNSDVSPFSQFIRSAWEDIGGVELEELTDPSGETQETFSTQRRDEVTARKSIDLRPDDWRPDWFNRICLSYLRDPRVIELWSRKHS